MSLRIIDLSSLRERLTSPVARAQRTVASTAEVNALLDDDAVVAIGVSGGKDSVACALATARYLDMIGHTGPRVLVHADLGRVEWKDSAPACERLAARLGWELLTVRRQAGDMLARAEALGKQRHALQRTVLRSADSAVEYAIHALLHVRIENRSHHKCIEEALSRA